MKRLRMVTLAVLMAACASEGPAKDERPEITVSPASLDFGSVSLAQTAERALTIANSGSAKLQLGRITIIEDAAQAFSVGRIEASALEAGETTQVAITYRAPVVGSHTAQLILESNAASSAQLLVPLAGTTASEVDPCAGKVCDDPPTARCLDATTERSFDVPGTCQAGECSYASHDALCPDGCEETTGRCRGACPEGEHRCSGECVSDASIESCGSSCTPCGSPEDASATCDAGVCAWQCNQGFTRCDDACCPIPPVGAIRDLSAGWYVTCAATSAGETRCWGINDNGEVGDGTTENRSAATPVAGLSSGVIAVNAAYERPCALTDAGSVWCWGNIDFGTQPTPIEVESASGAVALMGGLYHHCILTASGGVKCWGENDYGQLGDGTTDSSPVPLFVVGLGSGVTSLATGSSSGNVHTCVVVTGGGVRCWGHNEYGELGDGSFTTSLTPVAVTGLSGVQAVSVGIYHTCALTSAGGVECWGFNRYGDLGVGDFAETHALPTDVVGLTSGVRTVVAGGFHTCAITDGGALKCWGANDCGEVGDGTTENRSAPVDVATLGSGVIAVGVGDHHTCAALQDGTIKCWGANRYGALGNPGGDSAVPVDVTWE